jgi:hypothetical protein
MHFRGLIEGDLVERRLHGEPEIAAEEVDAAIVFGAEAFLRAYSINDKTSAPAPETQNKLYLPVERSREVAMLGQT